MAKLFSTLCLILLAGTVFSQNEPRYVGEWYEFEEGSTEMLYGDRVVLRKGPGADSKALDTLAIGTSLTIIEKAGVKSSVNGLESEWYKVKVGKKTGYVIGGLIALDRVQLGDTTFLIIAAANGEKHFARCRVILPNGEYYGHEQEVITYSFQMEVSGNKGVEDIHHIVEIYQLQEACGVVGGPIYLFDDGSRLIHALTARSVSDAGAFWFSERLIFPGDSDGYWGAIRFEREYGEPVDEELGWSKSIVNEVILKWEEDHLTPDVRTINFQDDF